MPEVFISYSHADEQKWLNPLLKVLKPYFRRAPATVWWDDKIKPGQRWRTEIDEALKSAKVGVLLVSSNFLASDFITEHELPYLLEAAASRGVKLLAVLLTNCLYDETDLKNIQFVNPTSKPLNRLRGANLDDALVNVCKAIRSEVAGLQGESYATSGTLDAGVRLHTIQPPIADFVARSELAELRELCSSRGPVLVGLHGAGGSGKTELARHCAQELKQRYPDAAIEVDLRGSRERPLAPSEAMKQIILAFHPDAGPLPDEPSVLQNLYRSILQGKHFVLLFDDARDKAQVEQLLPPPDCALIITSRSRFLVPKMRTVSVGRLTESEALELSVEIARGRLDFSQAKELIELCDSLPLAIRIAATTIAEKVTISIPEHLRRLRQNRLKTLEPVAAAINASFELIPIDHKVAWTLLGIFPVDFEARAVEIVWRGITLIDVAEASSTDTLNPKVEDALAALHAVSLVEYNEDTRRFRLHDLARLFALDVLRSAPPGQRLENTARRKHAGYISQRLLRANNWYTEGTAPDVLAASSWFDQEQANIEAAFQWAAGAIESDKHAIGLVTIIPTGGAALIGDKLSAPQRVEWFEICVRCSDSFRHPTAPEFKRVALGNLGIAYQELGEQGKALDCFEKALSVARTIQDHSGESNVLTLKGSSLQAIGNGQEAISCFTEALSLARQIGDKKAERQALAQLGIAYICVDDTKNAVQYTEEALAITRDIGDARNEAHLLLNSAEMLARLGRHNEALQRGEAALGVYESLGSTRAEFVRAWLSANKVERIRSETAPGL